MIELIKNFELIFNIVQVDKNIIIAAIKKAKKW
jgi:hypothetical protein